MEQEVASLRERLEHEASKNKAFQGAYWSKPFQTEHEKAMEDQGAVSCMRRNAGLSGAGMMSEMRVHGEQSQRDRASMACELGAACLQDRASLEQAHGEPRHGDRACFEHVLGDSCLPDWACNAPSMMSDAVRACATPGLGLGDVSQPIRACNTPELGLGDVYQPGRAGNTPGQGPW